MECGQRSDFKSSESQGVGGGKGGISGRRGKVVEKKSGAGMTKQRGEKAPIRLEEMGISIEREESIRERGSFSL